MSGDNTSKDGYLRILREMLDGKHKLYVLNPSDGYPRPKSFYLYNDRCYLNNGEDFIRRTIRNINPLISKYLIDELVDCIRYNDKFRKDREDFDSDINLLNLENGVFDINNRLLLPHDSRYLLTMKLPIRYQPQVKFKGSIVERFMNDITKKDKQKLRLIQEMCGYCLYRSYNIQKAFLLVGEGANGKSTLLELLSRMLSSENVSNVSIEEITNGGRFVSYRLYNKLANVSSELGKKTLKSTTVFKMATGGDKLTHERKYRDAFEFYNYSKLIFAINEVPSVSDNSMAFYRRWIPIEFNQTFSGKKCDVDIIDKLTTTDNISILFSWSLEGLYRLLDNGEFSDTWNSSMVENWWNKQTSDIYTFILDNYVFTEDDAMIPKGELYKNYVKHCLDDGYIVKHQPNGFSREINSLFRGKVKSYRGTGGVRYWKGIEPKPFTPELSSGNVIDNYEGTSMEEEPIGDEWNSTQRNAIELFRRHNREGWTEKEKASWVKLRDKTLSQAIR